MISTSKGPWIFAGSDARGGLPFALKFFALYYILESLKWTFDVYSLGVVLVEIATWQVIETVLGIEDPKSLSASALKDIQPRLLCEKCHLESIGANAGVRFRRATESCLDSTAALGVNHLDDEMNVHVAAKVSRNFYHQVLLPLDEIQT